MFQQNVVSRLFVSVFVVLLFALTGSVQSQGVPVTLRVVDEETGLEVEAYDYQVDRVQQICGSSCSSSPSTPICLPIKDYERSTEPVIEVGTLRPGKYMVRVCGCSMKKPGGLMWLFPNNSRLIRDNRIGYQDFTVTEGDEEKELSVSISATNGFDVKGSINVCNGEFPGERIKVSLSPIRGGGDKGFSIFHQDVETDKEGNFTFHRVLPGSYGVLIRDSQTLSNKHGESMIHTFHTDEPQDSIIVKATLTGNVECKLKNLSEDCLNKGTLVLFYEDGHQIIRRLEGDQYTKFLNVAIGSMKVCLYDDHPYTYKSNPNNPEEPPRAILDKTQKPFYSKTINVEPGRTTKVSINPFLPVDIDSTLVSSY